MPFLAAWPIMQKDYIGNAWKCNNLAYPVKNVSISTVQRINIPQTHARNSPCQRIAYPLKTSPKAGAKPAAIFPAGGWEISNSYAVWDAGQWPKSIWPSRCG